MDRDLPVDGRISFIVRVARGERARLTGVVERVGTGEKHRFASVAEVSRIIERIVAAEQDDRPARGRR
jgi:hypothetical protein